MQSPVRPHSARQVAWTSEQTDFTTDHAVEGLEAEQNVSRRKHETGTSVSINVTAEEWKQNLARAEKQQSDIAMLQATLLQMKGRDRYFGPEPADDSGTGDPSDSSLIWNLNSM